MAQMQVQQNAKSSLIKTVIATGLFAGILDISAAIINYVINTGKNPVRIFYFIASAVFGKAAYEGGWPMVVAGVFFHFLNAFLFTFFYFLCYPYIKFLSGQVIISGLLYGIFIWIVMNVLVLPLTKIPFNGFHFSFQTVLGIVILMLCVGLPVAVMADRFFKKQEGSLAQPLTRG